MDVEGEGVVGVFLLLSTMLFLTKTSQGSNTNERTTRKPATIILPVIPDRKNNHAEHLSGMLKDSTTGRRRSLHDS